MATSGIVFCLLFMQVHLLRAEIVDLSHLYNEQTPFFPDFKPFEKTVEVKGQFADKPLWAEINRFSMGEHVGTHMDAPCHLYKGRWRMHDIPIERLIGPMVVIDISEKAAKDPDARVLISDIEAWEKQHGRIPEGAILFMHSGWAKYAHDPAKYRGTTDVDDHMTRVFHFPGIDPDAAEWLVKNRVVYGVGVDTLSLDAMNTGPNYFRSTHTILFDRNIYGMENVANLDKVPASGARVLVMPMKIWDGSGAPARIVAVWDEEKDK